MTIMALENHQKDTGAAESPPPSRASASTRTFTREQVRLRERYGPWAVVTGASDGIGREFAARLAEAGVNLVLAARRQELLDDVANGLARAHDVQVEAMSIDLATPPGVAELLARTRDRDVGLLIASAGFGTSGPFVDATLDEELGMIDVNCRAVAALSHAFGRRFVDRKRGGIVLMSSLVALLGVPRAANYAATKAYVQSLAERASTGAATSQLRLWMMSSRPRQARFAAGSPRGRR